MDIKRLQNIIFCRRKLENANEIPHQTTLGFLANSPSPERKSVIDIGCGDGFASVEFKKRGAKEIIANDLSCKVRPLLLQYSIPFLPLKDVGVTYHSHFDIVWCQNVLEHQEHPIEFLKNLYELLNPAGELWLTVPNCRTFEVFSLGHIINFNMPTLIEHFYRAHFDTKNGHYWTSTPKSGHLRVRIPKMEAGKFSDYPTPMAKCIKATGRCPANLLEQWNWKKGK